jgi:hypothetical protein
VHAAEALEAHMMALAPLGVDHQDISIHEILDFIDPQHRHESDQQAWSDSELFSEGYTEGDSWAELTEDEGGSVEYLFGADGLSLVYSTSSDGGSVEYHDGLVECEVRIGRQHARVMVAPNGKATQLLSRPPPPVLERMRAQLLRRLGSGGGAAAAAAEVRFLGDAKSSLGDAKSSLGGAKSSLGDAKSSLGDT